MVKGRVPANPVANSKQYDVTESVQLNYQPSTQLNGLKFKATVYIHVLIILLLYHTKHYAVVLKCRKAALQYL